MAVYFWYGSTLVGTANYLPDWADDRGASVTSQCFVCPTCGEVWGRIQVEGKEWLPLRRGCAKHDWLDVGGSFLPPWVTSLSLFPREVLLREFLLRYQHATKD